MFGLEKHDIDVILTILKKIDEVDNAIVFGSRAKGNFKKGSDLDLAIQGENVNGDTVLRISLELNEGTMIPLKFDVFDFNTISNIDLREHINRVGKSLYKKDIGMGLNEPEENYGE